MCSQAMGLGGCLKAMAVHVASIGTKTVKVSDFADWKGMERRTVLHNATDVEQCLTAASRCRIVIARRISFR